MSRRGMTRVWVTMGIVLLASCFVSCISDQEGEETTPSKPIEEVLETHTKELMAIDGVVGTAQGLCSGEPCIRVFVVKKTPEIERKIPASLEGYPVAIQETGSIEALPKNRD